MSEFLVKISSSVNTENIKTLGALPVDLHFSEKTPSSGNNNIQMNVFVNVTERTTISELDDLGLDEARKFLERVLKSLG